MRTREAMAGVALLGLLGAGCLVQITHVSDPSAAFARAHIEAERDAAYHGRASQLNVLAWDPGDHEMVRVSVPLWLLHDVHHDVDWDDVDGDGHHHEAWRRQMSRLRWEDVERAGPGILLEVAEDRGDRVLVWLR